MNKNISITGVDETQKLAVKLSKEIKKGDVICFYGDLGSGKTTFIQAFAKGMGIKRRIISPTFIIARKYGLKDFDFYHIDLYRTASKHDLETIGLREILNTGSNIVAIEWAEKLGDLLPNKRIDVKLKYLGDNSRTININKYG